MAVAFEQLDAVPGFTVPVHRALTEHIMLGGAPRSIAIMNGTLAGAVGLGLRLCSCGHQILALWIRLTAFGHHGFHHSHLLFLGGLENANLHHLLAEELAHIIDAFAVHIHDCHRTNRHHTKN